MHRRAFIAAIAAGPIAVVAGPSCGPTNPPPDGVWIGGEWVSSADIERWTAKFDEFAREINLPAPPKRVYIGKLTMGPDLREADPDRCMREWIKPVERMARRV